MILTVFRSRLRPESSAEYQTSQRAWATEARHVEAKKRGRAAFYQEYTLQVCRVLRESAFRHPGEGRDHPVTGETAGTPPLEPAE